MSAWYGVMAPAGTPRKTVDRLSTEINAVLKDPAVVKRLNDLGADIGGGSVQDFGRFVEAEIKRHGEVVKAAGAKLDRAASETRLRGERTPGAPARATAPDLRRHETRQGEFGRYIIEHHPKRHPGASAFRNAAREIADQNRPFLELHEAGVVGYVVAKAHPVGAVKQHPRKQRRASAHILPRLPIGQASRAHRTRRKVTVTASIAALYREAMLSRALPERAGVGIVGRKRLVIVSKHVGSPQPRA
jgi:predicted DNA-binding transcriptional regulator